MKRRTILKGTTPLVIAPWVKWGAAENHPTGPPFPEGKTHLCGIVYITRSEYENNLHDLNGLIDDKCELLKTTLRDELESIAQGNEPESPPKA